MRIELVAVGGDAPRAGRDWPTIEQEWRRLEGDSDCSFFQSWTWIGCEVATRFDDPWILRATEAEGYVVGLALLNRTGPWLARTFHLHETGRPDLDSVFIEHNGPVVARGHEHVCQPMLAKVLRHGRLIMSGVGAQVLDIARRIGVCRVTAARPAPFALLHGMRDEVDWLNLLSASTRHRLRRSWRALEGGTETLEIEQAENVVEATEFLDALVALHQRRWVGKGRPGAFAQAAFQNFHHALLSLGVPRGEVQLLRICLRSKERMRPVGYLLNFCSRGRVYAYQSGVDYSFDSVGQLPGLTCHHLAIRQVIERGYASYDFLAGDARYKTSLSSNRVELVWVTVDRPRSLRGLWRRMVGAVESGFGVERGRKWLDDILRMSMKS